MHVAYTALLLLLIVAGFPVTADAARVYLDTEEARVNALDTFYVPVRLDTEDACINAVSATIYYDPTKITVIDTVRGSSIIPLWIEEPQIAREGDKDVGKVTFSGGMPGGYCGRVLGDPGLTNILLQLVVTGAPNALDGVEELRTELIVDPSTTAYLHDGTGRPASTTVLGTEVVLVTSTTSPSNVWLGDVQSDTIAPEFFEIILVEGPSEGHERHYIAFSTTDKQSGIDHYEVRETDPDRFGFLTWLPNRSSYWVEAQSPYVLRDQTLTSKIMVKAVDKNGNERIVTYTPPLSPIQEITRPETIIVVIVLILLLLTAVFVVRRMHRKRRLAPTQSAPLSDQEQSKEDDL